MFVMSAQNLIVIMTSNTGSKSILDSFEAGKSSGQSLTKEVAYEAMKLLVRQELQKSFRPEFLNRLDGSNY